MSSGFFPSYYGDKIASRGPVSGSPSRTSRHYFCVECDREYTSTYSLYRHFSVIHRISYDKKASLSPPSPAKSLPETSTVPSCEEPVPIDKSCPLCSVSLGRSSYTRHMINEHDTEPFLCTTCGDRFTEYKELISHKQIHIEGKQAPVKSVDHSSSIEREENESNLTAPVTPPAIKKVIKCEYCLKELATLWHMFGHSTNHNASFLEPGKNGMYNCNFCNRKFIRRGQISSHLYNHRDLLKCKSCNKQCFSWKDWDHHIKQCVPDSTVAESFVPPRDSENITESEQLSSHDEKQKSSQEIFPDSFGSEDTV